MLKQKLINTFSIIFEKVAQSLKWPKEAWILLLQSGLVGKARAVYSALSVEESSQYDTVKMSILKAYELVSAMVYKHQEDREADLCRVWKRKGNAV